MSAKEAPGTAVGPAKPAPSVVVVHPGHRPPYHVALAAQEEGALSEFVTGLYYAKGNGVYRLLDYLPARIRGGLVRQLIRRHLPGLAPERVTSLAWLELPKLALTRSPAVLRRALGESRIVGRYTSVFEWYASLSVPREGQDIIIAFQGAALRLLRRARNQGKVSILDQADAPSQPRILREEHQQLGLPLPAAGRDEARVLQEIRLADWYIAPSDFVAGSLVELGVGRERIAVIPYGVDLRRFCPGDAVSGRPFTALYVGQIGMRKGLHYLLQAWQELRLPGARLVLIGSPHDTFGWRLLKRYQGFYTWLPDVPNHELPSYYQKSDIFVLPTLAEGSALVIYEALASGLPVVTTPNAGSIVRDGVEGMVVPIRDISALKTAILALYTDDALRRSMGRAARVRVEDFSWERYRERIRAMLHDVWARSQARAARG